MTDDELRRLIAECEDTDHGFSYQHMPNLAPVLRDALRFRHITRNADHMPDPEPAQGKPPVYGWSVQWGMWCDQGASLRAAIDADMEASR